MAGDKTEPPTPKRLEDARKKGQVFKSNELTVSVLFVVAGMVLSAGGSTYFNKLKALMTEFFQPDMLTGQLPLDLILHRMGDAWARMLLLLAPLLGALFVAAIALNFLQVKVIIALDVIKPKFEKLNPIQGFQNLFFKSRIYIELVKNLIKLAIVGFLCYSTIRNSLRDVVLTARVPLAVTAHVTGDLLFNLLQKIGGVLALLGAADYAIQKKMYMKNMMMSKQEITQEYKQDEGDPHVKHQRKHLFQEMMNEDPHVKVPKADAVVVNPTHYAIAIQYDEKVMMAPKVTAKGQHQKAQTIIEIAKKHRVPIMRNVELAHKLYEVDVGADIPENLYEAVAEVLNWVYELSQMEEA
jgi:type III secretion YscU/HrpY family protein